MKEQLGMPFVDRELPADFKIEPIAPRKYPGLRPYGPDNPPKGREKGATSKIVRDLKEGLITAAENIGDDGNGRNGLVGYLEDLGRHHKRAFASLLVKLLPMQLHADVNRTDIGEIRIVSIPAGSYLSQEDADRLAAPGLQLEHDPQPVNGTLGRAVDVEIDPASQTSPSDPRDPGAHHNGCDGQPDEAETIADLKRQINELARKAGLPIAV